MALLMPVETEPSEDVRSLSGNGANTLRSAARSVSLMRSQSALLHSSPAALSARGYSAGFAYCSDPVAPVVCRFPHIYVLPIHSVRWPSQWDRLSSSMRRVYFSASMASRLLSISQSRYVPIGPIMAGWFSCAGDGVDEQAEPSEDYSLRIVQGIIRVLLC